MKWNQSENRMVFFKFITIRKYVCAVTYNAPTYPILWGFLGWLETNEPILFSIDCCDNGHVACKWLLIYFVLLDVSRIPDDPFICIIQRNQMKWILSKTLHINSILPIKLNCQPNQMTNTNPVSSEMFEFPKMKSITNSTTG